MQEVPIPWRAWYGDGTLVLSFPDTWQVRTYWPADAPPLSREALEQAFKQPIGTPPLTEMARGKRWVSIAVDDISRPAPAAPILPLIMRQLEQAGIDLDRVRVVLGTGTHRPMVKADIVKKLGQTAADRLDVYNNHPYGNVVDLGTSRRGIPIHISRPFAEADLRIGIGSITPHAGPGFGGGAKVVIPGVAGFETIAAIHRPGYLRTALIDVENNEFRAEIEHTVRTKVGLDCIVNVVVNAHREIAALVVGDMIHAHRAGVRQARQIYATELPRQPVDIAICNAYPKDTDFLQSNMALNILRSAPRPIVREGGAVVIISASPEGRGHHGLFAPGMRYGPPFTREHASDAPLVHREVQTLSFSPWVTPADARTPAHFRRWDALIAHLRKRYGDRARVAVFPCGSIQLARERVS